MAEGLSVELKGIAAAVIDGNRQELIQLGQELWKDPELSHNEHKAHELLTTFLEKKGFSVEYSYTGIETAFRATFGSGRPNICVICEYDALPEIGHACGHNLIAEAGVAAGLGLKAALEASGAPQARVTVLGTPAEEGNGGKVDLINNGAFEDVDVAMMVHPAPVNIIMPICLSAKQLEVTYTGKAAHAAAFPWEGVNALDAAVLAYTNISALRQQMKPQWRVHGITLNGGADPPIIPNKTALHYYVRTASPTDQQVFERKVTACFEAAALATGCQVEIRQRGHFFNDLNSDPLLARLYAENFGQLGEDYALSKEFTISTDMGNVSYTVPSIHPTYRIGSGELNHTEEFRDVANTPEAHAQTLTAAKGMAYTAIDTLTKPRLLAEVKASFEQRQ